MIHLTSLRVLLLLVFLGWARTFADVVNLSGEVLDSRSRPLSGVQVGLASGRIASTTSSANGAWVLSGSIVGVERRSEQPDRRSDRLALARGKIRWHSAGRDILGRNVSEGAPVPASAPAMRGSAGALDTVLLSWSGRVRARIPVVSWVASGLDALIDTTTSAAGENWVVWTGNVNGAAILDANGDAYYVDGGTRQVSNGTTSYGNLIVDQGANVLLDGVKEGFVGSADADGGGTLAAFFCTDGSKMSLKDGTIGCNTNGGGTSTHTTVATYLSSASSRLDNGDASTDAFTLVETTTLVLRCSMDYSGVCGIISAADQASFESGGAVGIWGYSGQYGTKRFTLPAGSYCLGIRSNSDGNSIVGEVDMDVELPESDGMYFQATPWNEVGTLTAGQKLTHGISIQAGHRYFVDGNNSGNGDVGVYVIPASELANFNAGRTFQYYADYSGEEGALPGFWELELPPGTYYLAMVNNGATTHAYTYQAEDWGP